MGKQVTKDFVRQSFEQAVANYEKAVEEVGLWESEEYVIDEYFTAEGSILDIGCGAGRTTFGLYKRGYTNIIGLDLTPEMITKAQQLKETKAVDIKFTVGDATDLEFSSGTFDYALFSFNGLMQIPKRANRIKALREIKRVLTDGGIFIFTTHDRETNDKFKEFWEQEKELWKAGEQDRRLYEYGDQILASETEDRDLFIHFPNREEIINCLKETGWELVEDFYRADLFTESEQVKEFSTECRFWVVKK